MQTPRTPLCFLTEVPLLTSFCPTMKDHLSCVHRKGQSQLLSTAGQQVENELMDLWRSKFILGFVHNIKQEESQGSVVALCNAAKGIH